MEQARQTYEAISTAISPEVAAYVVPNAYKRRVLLTFNFRTAMHFVQLRAAANAHFSVRRLAQRIAGEIRSATPLLGRYLANPTGETWEEIEANHFSAV
jgi:thymidylate synthase ThyX